MNNVDTVGSQLFWVSLRREHLPHFTGKKEKETNVLQCMFTRPKTKFLDVLLMALMVVIFPSKHCLKRERAQKMRLKLVIYPEKSGTDCENIEGFLAHTEGPGEGWRSLIYLDSNKAYCGISPRNLNRPDRAKKWKIWFTSIGVTKRQEVSVRVLARVIGRMSHGV